MSFPQFWQPASFRGAPFFVESYDNEGGRRGPDHQFPNKETGYAEDTGKQMEGFSVDAYVVKSIGDPEYASRRDALKKALNQKGPGELVHPAFGTVRVQLRTWQLGENKNRLGLVPFKLNFVEASTQTYPTARRSAASGMGSFAGKAHQLAAEAFSQAFAVAGKSDYLRGCVEDDVQKIGSLFSRMCSSFGIPIDSSSLLSMLIESVVNASDEDDNFAIADAVAAFPMAVTAWAEAPWSNRRNADGSYRGASQYNGGGPLEATAVASLFRVYDFDLAAAGITAKTAISRQQADNAAALAQLVRLSAVVESARVAPYVNWTTLQQAESARDRIANALDAEMETTESDELYNALADMRILVIRTVPPESGQLPALMDYMPLVTCPSLALSYRLYGASGRAEEIVKINGLRHPGFIPGQVCIQVLSNVG